jgi:hypothetical protein
MIALAVPLRVQKSGGSLWLALALAFAALILPDCCLIGHHAFGAGMSVFGPICRSSR